MIIPLDIKISADSAEAMDIPNPHGEKYIKARFLPQIKVKEAIAKHLTPEGTTYENILALIQELGMESNNKIRR